jgi:hypothetical protein
MPTETESAIRSCRATSSRFEGPLPWILLNLKVLSPAVETGRLRGGMGLLFRFSFVRAQLTNKWRAVSAVLRWAQQMDE